ncbi:hypothetical protein D3C73_808220 [compost metagenome]
MEKLSVTASTGELYLVALPRLGLLLPLAHRRSLLAADSMLSLSVAAQLAPFSPTGSVKMRHAACC